MTVLPYNTLNKSKKEQVEEMFDNISPKYDLLNHLLSLNIDKLWRKRAIRKLEKYKPVNILDIATGTGDFAIAAMRIKGSKVTGIDISDGMLAAGRKKIGKKGYESRIRLLKADSEKLPFDEGSFDGAIAGFGVRNFENTEKGVSEILRVLKPGGVFVVLEFSRPESWLFRKMYYFYFNRVLPGIGKMVSRDNRAYAYLPESVRVFPDGVDFIRILESAGFVSHGFFPQTMGIATIYVVQKP